MHRKLATHLSVLLIGVGLGVGAVAVASPNQTATASSDAQIVTQLKSIDKRLSLLNRSVSGYDTLAGTPSLRQLLVDVERNTSGTR